MKKIFLVLLLMISLVGCADSQPFVAFNYLEQDLINLNEEVVSFDVNNKSSLAFLLNPSSNFDDDIIFSSNDYVLYNDDLKLKTNKENYVVINLLFETTPLSIPLRFISIGVASPHLRSQFKLLLSKLVAFSLFTRCFSLITKQ